MKFRGVQDKFGNHEAI